jgi:hypothetical protein
MVRAFSFLPRMFDSGAEAAGDCYHSFSILPISATICSRAAEQCTDAKRVTEKTGVSEPP